MRTLLASAAAALLALPLVAHDFWIEPESFRPQPNTTLKVALKVGDFAIGDEVPRADIRILDFSLRGKEQRTSIVGRDGGLPAGLVRPASPGLFVLGYRSAPSFVELEAAKFEDYLREKGLDGVITSRAERGETQSKARELYSRCAKSLVQVGEGGPQEFAAMLDYPLEILPERNPCDLFAQTSTPAALPVRVFLHGKPLGGALLGALELRADAAERKPQAPILARTDGEGRAQLELPRAGRWMLAVVHMERAKDTDKADWESLWASLTFETAARPANKPAAR
jgi:uncharacterized GH25 family protein